MSNPDESECALPERARCKFDLAFNPLIENPLLIRAPCDNRLSPDPLLGPLLNPWALREDGELRSLSFKLHKARATLDSPCDFKLLHLWSSDVFCPRRDMLSLDPWPCGLPLHLTCTLRLRNARRKEDLSQVSSGGIEQLHAPTNRVSQVVRKLGGSECYTHRPVIL